MARSVFKVIADYAPCEVVIDAISDKAEAELSTEQLEGLAVLQRLALERHSHIKSRRRKRKQPSMTVLPIDVTKPLEWEAAMAFMPVTISLEMQRTDERGTATVVASADDTGLSVYVEVDDTEWNMIRAECLQAGFDVDDWFTRRGDGGGW